MKAETIIFGVLAGIVAYCALTSISNKPGTTTTQSTGGDSIGSVLNYDPLNPGL